MIDRQDLAAFADAIDGFVPQPPRITTPAEGWRWHLCLEIATKAGAFYEPTGVADPMFVAFAARGLYDSDIPTDDPADAPTAGGCSVPARCCRSTIPVPEQ